MRFKEFVNEAAIHVDMTLINAKIKHIKTLDIKTESKLVDVLNLLFKHEDIEFKLDLSRAGTNGCGGGTIGYRDNSLIVFINIVANAVKFLKKKFPLFAMTLSSIIEHELIHKDQLSKTPKNAAIKASSAIHGQADAYFANKNEIMAYANTIVRELQGAGHTDKDILEIIKHATMYRDEMIPPALRIYLDKFYNTPKVLNRIYKYMYAYLTKEDENE